MSKAMALTTLLGLPAGDVLAQQSPPAEPAKLTLPMGSRVRLQTVAAPGTWMKGILAGADSASVAIVPEDAPPLGANQLRLPSASVARFELATGKKRQWLIGLAVGAALGLVLGAAVPVDPVACEYNVDYWCSRGAALAALGLSGAAGGAGVGALVKTDRWTLVALDALAPPTQRRSGVAPQVRVLPGGVRLGVAVGF